MATGRFLRKLKSKISKLDVQNNYNNFEKEFEACTHLFTDYKLQKHWGRTFRFKKGTTLAKIEFIYKPHKNNITFLFKTSLFIHTYYMY